MWLFVIHFKYCGCGWGSCHLCGSRKEAKAMIDFDCRLEKEGALQQSNSYQ